MGCAGSKPKADETKKAEDHKPEDKAQERNAEHADKEKENKGNDSPKGHDSDKDKKKDDWGTQLKAHMGADDPEPRSEQAW